MNGPLPNQRHELFAHALARGETCDRAYQLAGFKANRGNASVLKSKQHIQKRVAEIQGAIAIRTQEKVAVDKAYVLAQAVKLHETSMAYLEGPEGFNAAAGNVASRALGQIGDHVDVQAFSKQTDVSVRITVDSALSKLAALEDPIEGEYTAIDGSSDPHHAG